MRRPYYYAGIASHYIPCVRFCHLFDTISSTTMILLLMSDGVIMQA